MRGADLTLFGLRFSDTQARRERNVLKQRQQAIIKDRASSLSQPPPHGEHAVRHNGNPQDLR